MGIFGADVLVVGAGVVGLSAALRLSQQGAEVVVADRSHPGSGASGLNGGMVQHSEAATDGIDALLERGGIGLYRWLAEERGHDIGFRPSGCLVLISTEEELDLARADLATSGAELLDCAQLNELEPATAAGLLGALRYPDAAQADPMPATLALAVECERAEVEMRTGHDVHSLESADAGWTAAVGQDVLQADHVIVAAGAWLSALVPSVEILPVRGQMWETRPVAHRLGHTIAAMESTLAWSRNEAMMRLTHPDGDRRVTRHVYGRQRSNGTIAFGGDRVPVGSGARPEADAAGIEVNHRHVQELLPGLGQCHIARTWAGLMPFTRDGSPMIGAVPNSRGLWVAGGLASNGFGRGPGAGHLVADLVLAKPTPPELATASPARSTQGAATRLLPG